MALINNKDLPIFYQNSDISKEQLDQLKRVLQKGINTIYEKLTEIDEPELAAVKATVNQTSDVIYKKLDAFDVAEAQITLISNNLTSISQNIARIQAFKAEKDEFNSLYADLENLEKVVNEFANQFDTNQITMSTFTMTFDDEEETLIVKNTQEPDDPTFPINKSLFMTVVADGGDILPNRAVQYTGAATELGISAKGKMADPTDPNFKPYTIMGISSELIPEGQSGKVVFYGPIKVGVLNTGWLANRILYLDPTTTAGELLPVNPGEEETTVKLAAPAVRIQMAAIINSESVDAAKITVRQDIGKKLQGAYDVDSTGLTNGSFLQYKVDEDGAKWVVRQQSDITMTYEMTAHQSGVINESKHGAPNKYHYPAEDGMVAGYTVNPLYEGLTVKYGDTDSEIGYFTFTNVNNLESWFGQEGNIPSEQIVYATSDKKYYMYGQGVFFEINYGSYEQVNAVWTVTELTKRFNNKADSATLLQDFDLETKYDLRTPGRAYIDWSNIKNVQNLADDSWRPPISSYTQLPELGITLQPDSPVTVGDVIFVGADDTGRPAFYMCVTEGETPVWDKFAQLDWDNNHSTLYNLDADDHKQYLLADGSIRNSEERGLMNHLWFNDNQALDLIVHKAATFADINGVEGKLWFDTSISVLKYYANDVDGWIPIKGAGAIIKEYETTAPSDSINLEYTFDLSPNAYEVGIGIMQVYRKVNGHYMLLDKDDFIETNINTITLTSNYTVANPVITGDEFYFRWANNVSGVEATIADGSVTWDKLAQPLKEQIEPSANPGNLDPDGTTYVKRLDGEWVPAVDFNHNHDMIKHEVFDFPSSGWVAVYDTVNPEVIDYWTTTYEVQGFTFSDQDAWSVELSAIDNEERQALQQFGLYNDITIVNADPTQLRFRAEKEFTLPGIQAKLEVVYEEAGVSTVTGSVGAMVIPGNQVGLVKTEYYNSGVDFTDDVWENFGRDSESVMDALEQLGFQQNLWSNVNACVRLFGGIIQDNNNGTVRVGSGGGMYKKWAGSIEGVPAGECEPMGLNTAQGGKLYYSTWDADPSVPITNNAYNYIFICWDHTIDTMPELGMPQAGEDPTPYWHPDRFGHTTIESSTNFYMADWENDSDYYSFREWYNETFADMIGFIPMPRRSAMLHAHTVGRVYKMDNEIIIRVCGTNGWNFNKRIQLFGEEFFPVIRARGLDLEPIPDTLKFNVTEGVMWAEMANRFTVKEFNMEEGDVFTSWYRHEAHEFDGTVEDLTTTYPNGWEEEGTIYPYDIVHSQADDKYYRIENSQWTEVMDYINSKTIIEEKTDLAFLEANYEFGYPNMIDGIDYVLLELQSTDTYYRYDGTRALGNRWIVYGDDPTGYTPIKFIGDVAGMNATYPNGYTEPINVIVPTADGMYYEYFGGDYIAGEGEEETYSGWTRVQGYVSRQGWLRFYQQDGIDPNRYNDASTGHLMDLGPTQYGVAWIYMVHDNSCHVVYGSNGFDTKDEANQAPLPSPLPGMLAAYSTLVGKMTFAAGSTKYENAESPFLEQFVSSQVSLHNDLAGLDGGDATQNKYYHLNETDYTRAVNGTRKFTGVSIPVSGWTADPTSGAEPWVNVIQVSPLITDDYDIFIDHDVTGIVYENETTGVTIPDLDNDWANIYNAVLDGVANTVTLYSKGEMTYDLKMKIKAVK